MHARILYFTLIWLSLAASVPAFAQDDPAWKASELAWRAERERLLRGPPPDGWLSLVAGYWLAPKATSMGSAPDNQIILPAAPAHLATLTLQNGVIRLTAPDHHFPDRFNINGQPAKEGALRLVGESGPPSVMSYDSLTLYAAFDDDDYALYVFDAQSTARRNFTGLRWYPLDRRYVITAKWEPYPQPVPRTVTTHLWAHRARTSSRTGALYLEWGHVSSGAHRDRRRCHGVLGPRQDQRPDHLRCRKIFDRDQAKARYRPARRSVTGFQPTA